MHFKLEKKRLVLIKYLIANYSNNINNQKEKIRIEFVLLNVAEWKEASQKN